MPDGLHGQPEARAPARAPARPRSRRAGSTGATPRRSPSPRCSREGVPIRLTGQDSERGTFSQRHLVLHDARHGRDRDPDAEARRGARASFEVYNSPLSEYACVGFEYGYSTAAPEALVLWEAQFGDFANGAQTIIDQFISSGLAKWQQTSRLTLLLPHGYEGNGPEHSSARLERFLQLAAQENMRIASPTHRGAVLPPAAPPGARPGRAPARRDDAEGAAAAQGRRPRALDRAEPRAPSSRCSTPTSPTRRAIRRLVLCAGKVYYDIVGHELADEADEVAVARIEQLYPFPVDGRPRADRLLPGARRGRLGAGGAAEHGRLAHDPPPARGGGRRACRCATSAGPGGRAPPRATRPRTRSGRTGSPAPALDA